MTIVRFQHEGEEDMRIGLPSRRCPIPASAIEMAIARAVDRACAPAIDPRVPRPTLAAERLEGVRRACDDPEPIVRELFLELERIRCEYQFLTELLRAYGCLPTSPEPRCASRSCEAL